MFHVEHAKIKQKNDKEKKSQLNKLSEKHISQNQQKSQIKPHSDTTKQTLKQENPKKQQHHTINPSQTKQSTTSSNLSKSKNSPQQPSKSNSLAVPTLGKSINSRAAKA